MTHDLRAARADEAAMSSRFVKIDPQKVGWAAGEFSAYAGVREPVMQQQ